MIRIEAKDEAGNIYSVQTNDPAIARGFIDMFDNFWYVGAKKQQPTDEVVDEGKIIHDNHLGGVDYIHAKVPKPSCMGSR
ncbi:hypothetical protein BN3087_220024 [Sulfurovum sp. enrichment culture clone C5]|uniref:Uncharacterized protein n=1 Tax=Sulfurovum sp. enrichment culture clone C5 TaxID=497650 RepID=A0A0S4XLM9_9BACT|nr:hypothetical protein BN3087_220024 [Sulfurovum sp. enrichment culture clone C5]